MHRHISLATLALFLIVGVPIRGLVAQRAPDVPAVGVRAAPIDTIAACTYMTCALRVEGGFLRGPRLVRGAVGTDVTSLNTFQPSEMSRVFSVNDSARVYGRRYARDGRIGTVIAITGGVMTGIAFSNPKESLGLGLAGLGVAALSIPFEISSVRSLSRAVWWYNASVVTPAPAR